MQSRSKRLAHIFLTLLLVGTVLAIYLPAQKASAVVPVNNASFHTATSGTTINGGLTVQSSGDLIVVGIQIISPCASNCSFAVNAPVITAGISDSFATVWHIVDEIAIQCPGSCLFNNGPRTVAMFSGVVAHSGGSDSITVTMSSSITGGGSAGFDALDALPLPVVPVSTVVGNCSTGSCGSPHTDVTAPTGQNTLSVASWNPFSCGVPSASPTWGIITSASAGDATIYNGNLTAPTNFPFVSTQNCLAYAEIGAVFGGTTTSTFTTTINTNCLGTCSGGANSSSHYLTRQTLYFWSSQAQASPGLIDNVTFKVAAVHIKTASTTLYVMCYKSVNLTSAGNPYLLAPSSAAEQPISNNTNSVQTPFFEHVNPQCRVNTGDYYAIAIMAVSNASSGSGASLSGISLFESSQFGSIEYSFPTGANFPPPSFYSNTVSTPNDFMYIHTTYQVAIIVTTSVLTVGGTATTTVTNTVETYATDAAATAAILPNIILMFVLLFMIPFIFMAIIVAAGGGGMGALLGLFFGATLSVIIGVLPGINLLPFWSIVLVGLGDVAIILALMKSGGTGGY